DCWIEAPHSLFQNIFSERKQARPEAPAQVLDALELGVGHLARPVIEQRVEQRVAVAEVVVEAALGDADAARQALDAHPGDASLAQGLEARAEPLRSHRLRLPYGGVCPERCA